jgi:predicted hydrolase (HD superfamily)
MKDKAFARAVDREAMIAGADLLGVDFDEHIQFVIDAMARNAVALGLQGVAGDAS